MYGWRKREWQIWSVSERVKVYVLSLSSSWIQVQHNLVSCWRDWFYTTSVVEINSLHPNIRMHFLHIAFYTYALAMLTRICLTIKSFFCWCSFFLSSWPSYTKRRNEMYVSLRKWRVKFLYQCVFYQQVVICQIPLNSVQRKNWIACMQTERGPLNQTLPALTLIKESLFPEMEKRQT